MVDGLGAVEVPVVVVVVGTMVLVVSVAGESQLGDPAAGEIVQ